MKLYSKRTQPVTAHLIYELTPDVKARVLFAFEQHCPNFKGGFSALMAQMESVVLRQYGHFVAPAFEALRRSRNYVEEHFFSCNPDQALDFVEACFQQSAYDGGQEGVDDINGIFREEGIGYELTPFSYQDVEGGIGFLGRQRKAQKTIYPKIIRRDAHFIHTAVLDESLKFLSDTRFHVANSEMLQALAALRGNAFQDAITHAASSFESFMKTICHLKGWPIEPHATCARLVSVLRDKHLFPPFYTPLFEAVGTVRNRLSSAHGRGPVGGESVSLHNAEHMIHMTASHMLFLAKSAGLA